MADMSFDEALEYSRKNSKKIIWLGDEPLDYIIKLMGEDEESLTENIIQLNPYDIVHMDKDRIKNLNQSTFLCYHGNASKLIEMYLKEHYGIETNSIDGGITRVIGREI